MSNLGTSTTQSESLRAGINIISPHGVLIANGEKTAVVLTKRFDDYLEEPIFLIQNRVCMGKVSLSSPIPINQEQFKKLSNKHMITDLEADKWEYSKKKTLFLYNVTPIEIWTTATAVKIPKGSRTWVKAENIKFIQANELSDSDLYIRHSEVHFNPGLSLFEYHQNLKAELIKRHLPHRAADWLDRAFVELIADVRGYNPSAKTAHQLADDWRIVTSWYAMLKKGKRFRYTEGEVKHIAVKIAREILKRVKVGKMRHTFRPNQMKEYPKQLFMYVMATIGRGAFFPKSIEPDLKRLSFEDIYKIGQLAKLPEYPEEIDPQYLEEVSDADLKKTHEWLHTIFKKRGLTEDIYNAHIFLWLEMKERGISHGSEKDALDEKTVSKAIEYPTPKGLEVDKIELEEVLKGFPPMLDLSNPPPHIYLVGSIVNLGEVPSDHDIDIVIKQEYPDKRLINEISSKVPEWLSDRLHFVFDKEGPLIGYSIPLYNLAYRRNSQNKASPWEVASFSAKPTLFRQFIGIKPRSGIGKLEFWDTQNMWNIWGSQHIERGIVVQEKLDGRRFFIHVSKADKKVKILTEDKMRDRAEQFPNAVKELLEKLNAKSAILDTEALVYDLGGKKVSRASDKRKLGELIPREDTASLSEKELTVGTVSEETESAMVFVVHDIVFLDGKGVADEGYSDRYDLLSKVVPKGMSYLSVVDSITVGSSKAFMRAVEKLRRVHGSEGVVAKASDSIYPIKYSGENRTKDWAKLKNLKEIDVMVWEREAKKTREGKELDQYIYHSAFLIPSSMKDKFKQVFEWKGKYYSYIGKSYSTSQKANKGDIITIRPVRIRIYEKDDKTVATWMFPWFQEVKKDKTEPDTWTTVQRIAKVGTAPLAEEDIKLKECPHWDNLEICPLREHFFIPSRDELAEEALQKMEYLKYPIKCPLAYSLRCKFPKNYYYDTKELEDMIDYKFNVMEASLSEEMMLSDTEIVMETYSDKGFYGLKECDSKYIKDLAAPKYMEIPPNNRPTPFVMQSHLRGKSQHMDFRFKVDGHLNGWTWVGGSKSKPILPSKMVPGKGFRLETKARQPLMWLRVSGEVKPGEPGGGVEAGGSFEILTTGKVVLGAQKPYFHEYFVKGTKQFTNWTRIVVRGIRAQRLDPETKKPIVGHYEMLWRGMVTKVQAPYAISTRAIKRGWKPPETQPYPFPLEWTKKNFAKKFKEWEEWRKGKKGEKKEEEASLALESTSYTLHQNSWKGPFHIRGVPRLQWYLRIDAGGVRSWYLPTNNPINVSPLSAQYEGTVPRKWLDYEGLIKPGERYNPLKELDTRMIILTKGNVDYTSDKVDGKEIITLKFKSGSLKGTWILEQEQKGADMYVFAPEKSLTKGKFVLQKHGIPAGDNNFKWHYDIRWDLGESYLEEINLYGNPLEEKGAIKAVRKRSNDKTWMDIEDEEKRKVGKMTTIVQAVDEGEINVIEDTEQFVSIIFNGVSLKGYYIIKKDESGWRFMESELPKPHSREETDEN